MQQSWLVQVQVCKLHQQGSNLKQKNGEVQVRKLHQQGSNLKQENGLVQVCKRHQHQQASNLKQAHLLEQGYPSMPLKFNIKWHLQLRRPSRLSPHRLSVHLCHPLSHSLPNVNPRATLCSPPSRNQNLFGNSSWFAM
jgi:hypothetical protein